MTRLTLLAALALAGCASTVRVELTVRSARDEEASLQLVRHDADGGRETLPLGRLLPHGRTTSRFVAERGGRLVLYADGALAGERAVPADAPDPFAVELRVD
ncbi:MAG: hypothetical protein KIT58_08095 [Planctomycetota bacterium]|nr:hypothetical protein [Planctomycetota bacterium]